MAKFTFQLEGVLRHRRNIERQRQRELALVQGQMQQLQDELRGLDQSLQSAAAELRRNRLVGRLDLAFLAAHRRFITAMQRKAISLAQRMALVQRQIEEARRALAEAAKQRKIIEKLKEKQYQRWLESQSKKETEQLDEVGMQLAFRQLIERRQDEFAGGDE